MPRVLGWAALFAVVLTAVTVRAEAPTPCLSECDKVGQSCTQYGHGTYEACRATVRKDCQAKPMAERFDCYKSKGKDCAQNHAGATSGCYEAVRACHAKCGPHPKDRADFWCEVTHDEPAANVRKDRICSGQPGAAPADQHKRCIEAMKPKAANVGYSLDCRPL